MGGLTLDIAIAFLIRMVLNMWRKLASAGWSTCTGKMTSYRYECPGRGCDVGEYRYEYNVDGNLYRGRYRKPYYIRRSVDVRKSGSIGAEIQVRFCPNDPAKSVLMDY